MDNIHSLHCPNCGSYDSISYFVGKNNTQDRCPHQKVMFAEYSICEYLRMTAKCTVCGYLVTRYSVNGKIIETSG